MQGILSVPRLVVISAAGAVALLVVGLGSFGVMRQFSAQVGEICGDGDKTRFEACDDGNTDDDDGCTADCRIEKAPGVTCDWEDQCTEPTEEGGEADPPVCGNGMMEQGEQCDDGNTADGDGCSGTCILGSTPACPGGTGACFPCGNGVCGAGETQNTCPQDCASVGVTGTQDGTLKILTNAIGKDAAFSYNIDNSAGAHVTTLGITTVSGQGTQSTAMVAPGPGHAITEIHYFGWSVDSMTCVKQDGTPTGTTDLSVPNNNKITGIDILPGQVTTCTFTNSFSAAPVSSARSSARKASSSSKAVSSMASSSRLSTSSSSSDKSTVVIPACGEAYSIQEFPIPATSGPRAFPWGITSAGGALWFTVHDEGTTDGVYHLEQIGTLALGSGRFRKFAFPTTQNAGFITQRIAAGTDGNVWFEYTLGGSIQAFKNIGKISPSGSVTHFNLPHAVVNGAYNTPNLIPWMTAGPGGNVWFTIGMHGSSGTDEIANIAPDGSVRTFRSQQGFLGGAYASPIPERSGPLPISPGGADGSLWAVTGGGLVGGEQEKLQLVHVRTDRSVQGYPFPPGIPTNNFRPMKVIAGLDGNLWYAVEGTLFRMAADGTVTPFAIPNAGDRVGIGDILAGPDGNVWFTLAQSALPETIGNISPQGAIRLFAAPSKNSGPVEMTIGPDGNLWFTQFNAGNLARLCLEGVPPPQTAVCGNGILETGEQCDDGNSVRSDGCSPSCTTDKGWQCVPQVNQKLNRCPAVAASENRGWFAWIGRLVSAIFSGWDGSTMVAQVTRLPTCANGVPTCASGTVTCPLPWRSTDGAPRCDATGTKVVCPMRNIALDAYCAGGGPTNPPAPPDQPEPPASNNNPSSSDSVSSSAGTASSSTGGASSSFGGRSSSRSGAGSSSADACVTPFISVCSTICGDAIQAGAEQCDDGNTKGGDGCSVACSIEQKGGSSSSTVTAYSSSSSLRSGPTICGDGLREAPEQCDDGNTLSGDGCSASCVIEDGYMCVPGTDSPYSPNINCSRGAVCIPRDGGRIGGGSCTAPSITCGDGSMQKSTGAVCVVNGCSGECYAACRQGSGSSKAAVAKESWIPTGTCVDSDGMDILTQGHVTVSYPELNYSETWHDCMDGTSGILSEGVCLDGAPVFKITPVLCPPGETCSDRVCNEGLLYR